MNKKESCNNSCSPSDYQRGGKCDINGCYDESDSIRNLLINFFMFFINAGEISCPEETAIHYVDKYLKPKP
jgi:hypothetical protein